MNNRTKAALIAGVVAGVLSAIPVASSCCCIWGIAAGVLAVYLYVKDLPAPIQQNDGLTLGAIAGGIAGAISLILGLPIALAIGAAAFDQAMRQANIKVPLTGMALIVVSTIVRSLILVVLGVLGGLIGVAIFSKNRPGTPPAPPPPPPPAGYGPQPPMGGPSYGGPPPPPPADFGTGS